MRNIKKFIKKTKSKLKSIKDTFVNKNEIVIGSTFISVALQTYSYYESYISSKDNDFFNINLFILLSIKNYIIYELPAIISLFGIRNTFIDSINTWNSFFYIIDGITGLVFSEDKFEYLSSNIPLYWGLLNIPLLFSSIQNVDLTRFFIPILVQIVEILIISLVTQRNNMNKPLINFGQTIEQQKFFLRKTSFPWVNGLLNSEELQKESFFINSFTNTLIFRFALFSTVNYLGSQLLNTL